MGLFRLGRPAWSRALIIGGVAAGMLTVVIGGLQVVLSAADPRTPAVAAPTTTATTEAAKAQTAAQQMEIEWQYKANMAISTQPTVAGDRVYWGSWDGYEHAMTLSGEQVWATSLGQTKAPGCNPAIAGVASRAAVATIAVRGTQTSAVFVGGGDARLYALDAQTGKILWAVRLGPSPAAFLWSNPLVYRGSVYMGVASLGDCPLTQGKLVQLNAATGVIQHTFNVVGKGCTGGSIWTPLALDDDDDALYFTTGNRGTCVGYAESVVRVRASDLTLQGSWRLPPSEQVWDSDFGAGPALFEVKAGTTTRKMVAVVNKNGYLYALDRGNLKAGPVWKVKIALGGDCPQCGEGSISQPVFDGTYVYVAGGAAMIAGAKCKGSVNSLDPATGAVVWQKCLQQGAVLGALVLAQGQVALATGNQVHIYDGVTGTLRYTTGNAQKAPLWTAPAFADGKIYIGSMAGMFFAFEAGR